MTEPAVQEVKFDLIAAMRVDVATWIDEYGMSESEALDDIRKHLAEYVQGTLETAPLNFLYTVDVKLS